MSHRLKTKNIIVVAGPTASGKTDLSIELAIRYSADIISADSRQVYRGMAIGTAQPDASQLAEVPHHFIADRDITDHYTCGVFEREALQRLDTLFLNNNNVVVVGGSGLYLNALCYGMDELPECDPAIKTDLMRILHEQGIESLREELKSSDPEYYSTVDLNNPNRLVRALEIIRQTGQKYSLQRSGEKKERSFNIIKMGILMDRDHLYARIDARVDKMIECGLVAEAEALYPHRSLNALQTVGYSELFEYMDGNVSFEEAVRLIKRNSRRYAKRQMTWFRKDADIRWFNHDERELIAEYIDDMAGSLTH